MLKRILERIARMSGSAAAVAPVELALAVLLFVLYLIASSSSPSSGYTWEDWWRSVAVSAIAFPALFSLSYLHYTERLAALVRWVGQGVTVVLCVIVAMIADLEVLSWGLGIAGMALGAWALMAVVPGLRGADPVRTAAYFSQVVVRLLLSALYALLLFLGVAGALAAVESLFMVSTGRLVEHFAGFAGVIVAPAMFFSFAKEIWAGEQEAFGGESRLVNTAAKILFAPLLTLYLVILYLYLARVLVFGVWPHGSVTPLVLGAAALGFAGQLSLASLWSRPERSAEVGWLFRAFPVVMILPLVMGFVALGMRIGQYGLTPMRYTALSLLILSLLLVGIDIWRRVQKRSPSITIMGALTAAFFVLGAVGPLSAVEMSVRSQSARVLTLAEAAGARVDGAWVSDETLEAISEDYLAAHQRGEVPVFDNVPHAARDFSRTVRTLRHWVPDARIQRKLGVTAHQLDQIVNIARAPYGLPPESVEPTAYFGWSRDAATGVQLRDGRVSFYLEMQRYREEESLSFNNCTVGVTRWGHSADAVALRVGDTLIFQGAPWAHYPKDLLQAWEPDADRMLDALKLPSVQLPVLDDGAELHLTGLYGHVGLDTRTIVDVDHMTLLLVVDEALFPRCDAATDPASPTSAPHTPADEAEPAAPDAAQAPEDAAPASDREASAPDAGAATPAPDASTGEEAEDAAP